MSHYSYKMSQRIAAEDPPFSSFIMAALRKADSGNFSRLQAAFPRITAEFEGRYNAPGGYLSGEEVE